MRENNSILYVQYPALSEKTMERYLRQSLIDWFPQKRVQN